MLRRPARRVAPLEVPPRELVLHAADDRQRLLVERLLRHAASVGAEEVPEKGAMWEVGACVEASLEHEQSDLERGKGLMG